MIQKTKACVKKLLSVFSKRANCFIALALVTAVLFSCLWLSVNNVSVVTNAGDSVQLTTLLSDPERILAAVNITYGADDKVDFTEKSFKDINISVNYAFPVYVTLGETTMTVTTTGATVGEILDLAKIMISETDIVNYDLDTVITKTAYIDVVDIDYVTETYTKRIYYHEKTTYSDAYPKGTQIVKDGSEGTLQVTCKKTIVNGVVTEEEILDEKVLEAAVDREVIIGTKKTGAVKVPANADKTQDSKPAKATVTTSSKVSSVSTLTPASEIELDANGNPVNYTKHLTVQATAYLAKGTCATGVKCVPGYIAVNPNYIPYGTKMYIKSSDGKYIYGYAIAADTGGFARNNPTAVDLSFATSAACSNFGRRNVEIYILD